MPITSFYIPRVSASTSRQEVEHNFNHIGTVHRVDFVSVDKKKGFLETNVDNTIQSVFVHCSHLTVAGEYMYTWIKEGKTSKIYLDYKREKYWLLLPAKNPFRDTKMNRTQIVENCRFLEEKMEDQVQILEEQAATIRHLNQRLDGVHKVVEQLVGSLFCQNSQSQIMRLHLSALYPEDYGYKRSMFVDDSNYHKWGSWATTRQGDECEDRIAVLENEFESIINDHAYKGEDHEVRIRALEKQIKETDDSDF